VPGKNKHESELLLHIHDDFGDRNRDRSISPDFLVARTASGEGKLTGFEIRPRPGTIAPEAIPQSMYFDRSRGNPLCASAKRRLFFYRVEKTFVRVRFVPPQIQTLDSLLKGCRRSAGTVLDWPPSCTASGRLYLQDACLLSRERGPGSGRCFSHRVRSVARLRSRDVPAQFGCAGFDAHNVPACSSHIGASTIISAQAASSGELCPASRNTCTSAFSDMASTGTKSRACARHCLGWQTSDD
jgi:hypothetical protein